MERVRETISAIARCLLKTADSPESFCSFAHRAAFPIKSLHFAHGTTLFETFFDKTPDVSHLRAFGFLAFMYLEKPKQKKLKVEQKLAAMLN